MAKYAKRRAAIVCAASPETEILSKLGRADTLRSHMGIATGPCG
jgi:hypothetical protein